MKYAIDRIEGDIIILENLENNQKIEIPLSLIEGAKEGDIIIYENGKYRKDEASYEERLAAIKDRMNSLRSDEEWKNHLFYVF